MKHEIFSHTSKLMTMQRFEEGELFTELDVKEKEGIEIQLGIEPRSSKLQSDTLTESQFLILRQVQGGG